MYRGWHIPTRWARTAAMAVAVSACALVARAEDAPGWPAAQIRLKTANTVAAARSDAAATAKIKDAAQRAKAMLAAGNAAGAEQIVRDAEAAAGLDPGGASMSGVPIYHPTPAMADQVARLRNDLDAALRAADANAVRQIVAKMRTALGDQAGLPTIASFGKRAAPQPIDPPAVVNLFLAALDENKPVFGQVAAGRPVGDNPVRFYAELAAACCDIRPLVKRYRPDQLEHLDQLVIGACFLMTALQQPAGHMPHPEPKGNKPDAKGQGRWVVSPAEDGGTQFDTGEAGAALLTAGITHARPEWTAAGLKAADWAIAQPCVRNFNYTACSVYLLAEAFRTTRNRKYLDAALAKWELGLAPAQLESGRWIDAHNARTAYHVILLRAAVTLAAVCPDDLADRRDAILKSATLGVRSLTDEFDRQGVTDTGYALPVLLRQQKFAPASDPRLATTIDQTAAAILAACVRDGRPHLGASLASVARFGAE